MTPDFLIVGAMKAGTTTLYHDLSEHPDIFLPVLKEPEVLTTLERLDEMRAYYARLFRPARPGQLKGEASTAYTKRPNNEGVAEKARSLCGDGLKIIYIRRDPVERIRSQYEHERQHGTLHEAFHIAVRLHPRLIDYSRYDWQIEPWIEAFGADNVLQLELETYSTDRVPTLRSVLRFIGADPDRLAAIDVNAVSNSRKEAKAIGNPLLRSFIHSRFYQLGLKRLFPREMREKVRRALLPAPRTEAIEIDPSTREYIRAELRAAAPIPSK